MNFIFIVNPIAGEKDKNNLVRRMESSIRMSHHTFIKAETHKPGDAVTIARSFAEKYGEDGVIVSCGGDGTIHEIVNGISGTKIGLMALPLGTGNDFCKKIYHTKKPNVELVMKRFGLLDANIRFDIMPIDVIDVNGTKCVNVMSLGFDTKVETIGRKIAGKLPFLGKQAYNLAVLPCLFTSMKYQADIDLVTMKNGVQERRKERMDFTLMAFCNASYYGGGFCPAPNSKLDDGILDWCYVDVMNIPKAIPVIPRYAIGDADQRSDMVHLEQVVSGKITSVDGSSLQGNCDGENFDYSEVNFKVLHKAVNLYVPQM